MEYQQDRFQCYICSNRIPPIAPGNYAGFGWPPCLECGHVLCQRCLEQACLEGNYEMCYFCVEERQFEDSVSPLVEYASGTSARSAFPGRKGRGAQEYSDYCQSIRDSEYQRGKGSNSFSAVELIENYHLEALGVVNDHFNQALDTLMQCRASVTEKLQETFEQYAKLVRENQGRTSASYRSGESPSRDVNQVKRSLTRPQIGLFPSYGPQDEDAMTCNLLSHVSLNSELRESVSKVNVSDSFHRKANSGPRRSGLSYSCNIPSVGGSFAVSGVEFDGQVLEAQNPSAFYVQPSNPQLEILKQIQISLNKDDNQDDIHSNYQPRKGDLCAAKWSLDQLWYRALIEFVETSRCFRVFFVDFGGRETLDVDSIRRLDPSMTTLPAQAVLCSLARVKPAKSNRHWTPFAIGAFSERALKKTCRLRVVEAKEGTVGRLGHGRKEYTLSVELFIDGSSVNEELVHRLLAVYVKNDPRDTIQRRFLPESRLSEPVSALPESAATAPALSPPRVQEVPVSPPVIPEPLSSVPGPVPAVPDNGRREVKLLSFVSPGDFTVCFADADHDPLFFHSALLAIHSSLPTATDVKRGQIYSVWNEAEGNYYRGRAVSDQNAQETSVTLDLIDAGTYLTVDKQHVKELPHHLCQSEPQSIRCGLSGVQPAGGASKWTQVSCERFTQLVNSAVRIFVEFVDADEESLHWNVSLYGQFSNSSEEDLVCVNDLLVSDGLALRKRVRPEAAAAKSADSRSTKAETKPVPRLSTYFAVTEWTSAEPLTEKEFSGYVTWINEHGHAHVQHVRNVNTSLDTISTALEAQYSKTQPEQNLVLKPGEACIARFSQDQVWYRASVVRVDDANQKALVMFCDYGNKEELPFSELRRRPICTNFPIQANKCLLDDVQPPGGTWTEEFAETLLTLVSGRCCQIEVKEFGKIPKISVYLEDGTPLRDLLDCPGLAAVVPGEETRTSVASSEDNDSDTANLLAANSSGDATLIFTEFSVPEVDRLLPVTLVQVFANGEAILRPAKIPEGNLDQAEEEWNQQIVEYQNAESSIERAVSSLPSISQADPMTPCIAWDQANRKWSRAVIRESPRAGLVLVEMIDTLQMVALPVMQLRIIPWNLCDVPRNAIKAKVMGLPASPADASLMEQRLKNRILWAQFSGGNVDRTVELFQDQSFPRVSILDIVFPGGTSETASRVRRLF